MEYPSFDRRIQPIVVRKEGIYVKRRYGNLWTNYDFMKMWIGETISILGSRITLIALPLAAALILQATPVQMGILGATTNAAFLFVGLFAGVWVDRFPRRSILIGANIGRALLMGLIPTLALLNMLRIEALYIIGLLAGVLTVVFDVAYQAFLPSVVGREDLIESNSKIETSRSLAQLVGPGLAGWLIGLFSAPLVIALDALSFLISALFLGTIHGNESILRQERPRSTWIEIREGLWMVFGSNVLRAIAFCTATYNLFFCMLQAVFILYMSHELLVSSSLIGLIFSIGSIGALVSSIIARPLVDRFGIGPIIMWGMVLSGFGSLLISVADGSTWAIVQILSIALFFQSSGIILYNVNIATLRQAIVPDQLLGRITASIRFCTWVTFPIGSLIGGMLGAYLGLWPTIVIAGIGQTSTCLWIFFSSLFSLREHPKHFELFSRSSE